MAAISALKKFGLEDETRDRRQRGLSLHWRLYFQSVRTVHGDPFPLIKPFLDVMAWSRSLRHQHAARRDDRILHFVCQPQVAWNPTEAVAGNEVDAVWH